MRVLYLTNYHNPYRDVFFEQLGKQCNLTVLFERRCDIARDASWFESAKAISYEEVYLPEDDESIASRTMKELIDRGWDQIIVGCYNELREIVAIEYMRNRNIPYVVNSDGLVFDTGNVVKRVVKRHVLRGATAYLIAGETCIDSLRHEVGIDARISSYPFSSLTAAQITKLAERHEERDVDLVLIVGQFEDYKGLDIMLDAIPELPNNLRYRFVGSGKKASELEMAVSKRGLAGIEVIPFLKPGVLVEEYLRAGVLVLPSRQECWGLVINEAAACGCPIVSTWGSGAAVEFLSRDYPQYLAKPRDAASLAHAISEYLEVQEVETASYERYLRSKAANYTIENMVRDYLELFTQLQQEL